jgi:RNA polymerase sigma-70 factor (ECF subfamily)
MMPLMPGAGEETRASGEYGRRSAIRALTWADDLSAPAELLVMDNAVFESLSLGKGGDPIGALEDRISLFGAIAQLPDRQRDVIVLRYCLDCSVAHTAITLGITEAGVRSTDRYARHRLREILLPEKEGHHDELHGH